MKNPKCINSNPAQFICTDNRCYRQNPFICDHCENRSCQKIHKKCMIKKWSNIHLQWQEIRNVENPQFEKMSELIESAIIKLINLITLELEQFRDWKKKFSMPQDIILLYECIDNDSEYKWNGNMIYNLINSLQNNSKDIIKINYQTVKNQVQALLQKSLQFQKDIKNLYSTNQKQILNQTILSSKPMDFQNIIQTQHSIQQSVMHTTIPFKITQSTQLMQFNQPIQKIQRVKSVDCSTYTMFNVQIFSKQAFLHKLNAEIQHLENKPETLQLKVDRLINQWYLYDLNEVVIDILRSVYICIYEEIVNYQISCSVTLTIYIGVQFSYYSQCILKSLLKLQNLYKLRMYNKLLYQLEQLYLQLSCKTLFIQGLYNLNQMYSYNQNSVINIVNKSSNLFNKLAFKLLMFFNIVAKALKSENLKDVQNLVLYWPLTLGQHAECMKYEKMIEESVNELPKLKIFKMICDDIKSTDSFKNLGNRFIAEKQPIWYNKEDWSSQ